MQSSTHKWWHKETTESTFEISSHYWTECKIHWAIELLIREGVLLYTARYSHKNITQMISATSQKTRMLISITDDKYKAKVFVALIPFSYKFLTVSFDVGVSFGLSVVQLTALQNQITRPQSIFSKSKV